MGEVWAVGTGTEAGPEARTEVGARTGAVFESEMRPALAINGKEIRTARVKCISCM